MTDLFLNLLNISLSASYLVLAVILLRFLLKKAPKWVSPLLWGLVALRLVVPVSVESVLSLLPSARPIPADIVYAQQPAIDTGIEVLNNAVNPILTDAFAPAPTASANPLQIWLELAGWVWALGLAVMLVYTAISYFRLRCRLRRAVPVGENIYRSRAVTTPFVLGLFRPRIYLPKNLGENEEFYIVAHEKAHLRRFDHWWKPLGFVLLSIHWFNPLMWLAYALLCRDIELACDEKVIQALGRNGRADYSQALLTCSIHRRSIAACPLAFGEVGVKQRVKSVLSYKKPGFWIIALALVTCAVTAVCFLTDPVTGGMLTMKDLRRLAQQEDLTWADLEGFDFEQTGADLTVRRFPMEGTFYLDAVGTDKEVRHVYLCCGQEDNGGVGIREADLDTFLKVHDHPLEEGVHNHFGITLTVDEALSGAASISYGEHRAWKELEIQATDLYKVQRANRQGDWEDVLAVGGDNGTVGAYDIYDGFRETLSWRESFGNLPDGCYRLARQMCASYPGSSEREYFMVYGEFTVGEAAPNPWGLSLSVEKASDTSANVLFVGGSPREGEELLGGNDYVLEREVEGIWEKVPSLTDPTFAEEAYVIDNNRRHLIDWEWLYGSLPQGHYRIGKQARLWTGPAEAVYSDVYGQLESYMVYGEFYLGEEENTYTYGVTIQAHEVTPEHLVLTFHRADGAPREDLYPMSGFTLERKDGIYWKPVYKMGQEKVGDAINFRSASDPQNGLYLLWEDLGSLPDGRYRIGQELVTSRNLEEAERFTVYDEFNVSTEEWTNGLMPLAQLPENYHPEDAQQDGCLVLTGGQVRSGGEEIFNAFKNAAYTGEGAFLRFVTSFSGENSYTVYVHDLSFDGTRYTLRWLEDGEEQVRTYGHLVSDVRTDLHTADNGLDITEMYVLTNDPSVWVEGLRPQNRGIQEGVDVDHEVVFSNTTVVPGTAPEMPDTIVRAELQYGGETLVRLDEGENLDQLWSLLQNAELIGGEPKTHSVGVGLNLICTASDGTSVTVELDPDNDICRINREFCQYGQVEQPNIEKLWSMLGLTQWPDAVYEDCLNAHRPGAVG